MNVVEIVEKLDQGETVAIRTSDALDFMREFEKHELARHEIQMTFDGPKCEMRIVKEPNDPTN